MAFSITPGETKWISFRDTPYPSGYNPISALFNRTDDGNYKYDITINTKNKYLVATNHAGATETLAGNILITLKR